jgi:transcriptional regulator with XRE-family HTH domain
MAGKKSNRKALTLEDQQRFIKKIGNRLKEVRKGAGYSAALDLAYEKDLPAAQYARYEVGANMKVISLLKALHALDISPAEFFKDFK